MELTRQGIVLPAANQEQLTTLLTIGKSGSPSVRIENGKGY